MLEIEFYETESGKKVILDFLESLPVKHRARAIREMEWQLFLGHFFSCVNF